MKLQYIKDLTKIGLTKNEAIFYEALLKFGPANASKISSIADLDKSSAYRSAESLVKLGLINYEPGKEKVYIANPPEILRTLLEEKKKHIIKQENELSFLIKDIYQSIKLNSITSKITVYENFDAPQKIWNDMLESDVKIQRQMIRMDIQKFFVDNSSKETYETWVENYIKERVKKKIFLRYLCSEEWADQRWTRSDPKTLKEVRILPKSFKLKTNIITGGNKFGTHTIGTDNIKGILIRDENITATQNQLFDFIWEQSKKI